MLLLWILVLVVGIAYLAHRRIAPLPALGIVAVYAAGDGRFQPRARLAHADFLGVDRSRRRALVAAGPAPQILHRADVQLVPENPAADVANRT